MIHNHWHQRKAVVIFVVLFVFHVVVSMTFMMFHVPVANGSSWVQRIDLPQILTSRSRVICRRTKTTTRTTISGGRNELAFTAWAPWRCKSDSLQRLHRSERLSRTFGESSNVNGAEGCSVSQVLNFSTIERSELEAVLVKGWGYPKYRADQVWDWIRTKGVTDVDRMVNLPLGLREQLKRFGRSSSLELVVELVSKKDGTVKRAYRCHDGQVIESVLMPYDDGRFTACISSQAGCAQGCVFCATGQMGFARQLTSDEIFEQVSRFAAELRQGQGRRLSNVVFMGMGEPLANYRNVVRAIQRINTELGIGGRRITISTVGIVPNIYKLCEDPDLPPGVRLAVSLHCATDEERSALLPANHRYGGLSALMDALHHYITTTGHRVTLEWALIAGTNDSPEVARQLGRLLTQGGKTSPSRNSPHPPHSPHSPFPALRRDMVHVNVIPLNPTGQFASGRPSQRASVNVFVDTLVREFGIACTPRVRRGIDINAGCGQLKAAVLLKKKQDVSPTTTLSSSATSGNPSNSSLHVTNSAPSHFSTPPIIGVYDDEIMDDTMDDDSGEIIDNENRHYQSHGSAVHPIAVDAVDLESAMSDSDFQDPYYAKGSVEMTEAQRLIDLVKGSVIPMAQWNADPRKNQ